MVITNDFINSLFPMGQTLDAQTDAMRQYLYRNVGQDMSRVLSILNAQGGGAMAIQLTNLMNQKGINTSGIAAPAPGGGTVPTIPLSGSGGDPTIPGGTGQPGAAGVGVGTVLQGVSGAGITSDPGGNVATSVIDTGGNSQVFQDLLAQIRDTADKQAKYHNDIISSLYGAGGATQQGTVDLTNKFLSNPEAINDRTQQMILNRSQNQIGAQQAAQQRLGMGRLAAAGQDSSGAMAAMNERLARMGMAQQGNMQSSLDIARAQQRNQDWINAINAGKSTVGMLREPAALALAHEPQFKDDTAARLAYLQGGYNGLFQKSTPNGALVTEGGYGHKTDPNASDPNAGWGLTEN